MTARQGSVVGVGLLLLGLTIIPGQQLAQRLCAEPMAGEPPPLPAPVSSMPSSRFPPPNLQPPPSAEPAPPALPATGGAVPGTPPPSPEPSPRPPMTPVPPTPE